MAEAWKKVQHNNGEKGNQGREMRAKRVRRTENGSITQKKLGP